MLPSSSRRRPKVAEKYARKGMITVSRLLMPEPSYREYLNPAVLIPFYFLRGGSAIITWSRPQVASRPPKHEKLNWRINIGKHQHIPDPLPFKGFLLVNKASETSFFAEKNITGLESERRS